MIDLLLANTSRGDIGVVGGRIVPPEAARETRDLGGRLVTPPLVEPHIHLDAALTVGQPRPNSSGSLFEGIAIWAQRVRDLTVDDIRSRVRQVLRWQLACHSYNAAYASRLIANVARAGLHMVTNPLDNAVLQGRFDPGPVRRGHTRVKELLAAGVNVAIGHDPRYLVLRAGRTVAWTEPARSVVTFHGTETEVDFRPANGAPR